MQREEKRPPSEGDPRDLSVRDILDLAGGIPELSGRYQISSTAIRHWPHRGIPRRYHKDLSELSGLPRITVLEASQKVRAEKG